MNIKEKILQELENPKILNLKFLFSEEVLDVALVVLNELLAEEKQKFEEKINTKYGWLDDKISYPEHKFTGSFIHSNFINQNIKDSEINSEWQYSELTFETLEDFSKLDLFFSLLNHLQNVSSSDKIREIIEEFEPEYVDFWNYISYCKRYYEMLLYVRDKTPVNNEEKRILDLSIKWYDVRWIWLPLEKQEKLKEINKVLSDLSLNFANNLLDSQKEFEYIFDSEDFIKDMSKDDLDEASNRAKVAWKEWYLFNSSPNCYIAVLKYCTDSKVRKYFYTEKYRFSSNWKFDNRKIVLDTLKYRDEKAKILWFKNYAELSLVFKMAKSQDEIISIIDEVTKKALEKAKEEALIFKKYFSLESIDPWDLSYYSRIYKEKEFNFDEKELKKYFEFDKVFSGLFEIVNRLYWIEMKEVKIDSYSENVKFYEVYKEWNLISYFLGDYFYNENKRSWAWCDNLRWKSDWKTPFIINVCAFQKWDREQTLLTLNDVEIMFHEFWHVLHEMLSKSEYEELSWFNVEWDFVELPSQLMENWCRDSEWLSLFARHIETWELIPENMLLTLEKLDKFWNWNFTLRQNEFSVLDMILHTEEIPETVEELDKKTRKIANKYGIFEKWEEYKMYSSFSHIFDWWYAAGYYSYMRAEIIEAQVWSIFKKNWIFDKATSKKFLDTILSAGTTKDAKDLFYDFSGRDVSMDAFLERKGF